jgi:ribonuclease VapC
VIVDTSALVSVFLAEPGYERFDRTIAGQPILMIPVPCFVEFGLLRRLGPRRMDWLDKLSKREAVSVVGIEPEQRELAAHAAQKYGKGSGHAAQLNFGDCLVYAVAKYRDLPLLFAGDDFSHTDITPALSPET